MPHTTRAVFFVAGFLAVVAAVIFLIRGRVPAPLPVILSTLVGMLFDRPHEIRAERLANGQCLRCGYDLTGNISGMCPECGHAR